MLGAEMLMSATSGLRRRSHCLDNPFSCPHCPASYSNRGSLVNHMSIHSGRTVCETCGKVFSTVSSRNRHINKHHPELEARTSYRAAAGGDAPPPPPPPQLMPPMTSMMAVTGAGMAMSSLPTATLASMTTMTGMMPPVMMAPKTSSTLFSQLPPATSLVRMPQPQPPPPPRTSQQSPRSQSPKLEYLSQ